MVAIIKLSYFYSWNSKLRFRSLIDFRYYGGIGRYLCMFALSFRGSEYYKGNYPKLVCNYLIDNFIYLGLKHTA